jgi:acyl-CoA thioester hydrolase
VKRLREGIAAGWDAQELRVPVQFHEVDSMRMVWHGHYLRYCEAAREAYCAARGLSYARMEAEGCPAPVIRAQLEYLAPARAGWILAVRCAHVPGDEPLLRLRYEIRAPVDAPEPGRLLCLAETLQAFVDASGASSLAPPPPVAAFFAGIAARERAAPR